MTAAGKSLMEEFDLYTKDRLPLGRTMRRGDPVPDGCFRLVIHVCLFNRKGEMLIQKRRAEKKTWPGKWDLSCGGHVVRGETSGEAAEREVREELGIALSFRETRPVLTVPFDEGFDDIYFTEKDLPLSDLVLQAEEVEEAAWASEDRILAMIASGEFIPYHPEVIRLFFALHLRGMGGMHTAPEEKGSGEGNGSRGPGHLWKLRNAVREDIPAISELFREMLRTIYRKEDADGYEEGYLERFFENNDDIITVAEENGRVVGYLATEVHREEFDYLYFDDLAVSEPCRGQGIGTALIRDAETYGQGLGIGLFVLHAEGTNTGARRLYERLGYRVLDEEGTRVRMIKKL